MSVTVTVRSRVPGATADVLRRAEQITAKAAYDIEARAKAQAPVDTGFLKSSIEASGSGTDWQVDAHAAYSIFLEFGTRRAGARPFLIPALEAVRPSYLAAMRRLA